MSGVPLEVAWACLPSIRDPRETLVQTAWAQMPRLSHPKTSELSHLRMYADVLCHMMSTRSNLVARNMTGRGQGGRNQQCAKSRRQAGGANASAQMLGGPTFLQLPSITAAPRLCRQHLHLHRGDFFEDRQRAPRAMTRRTARMEEFNKNPNRLKGREGRNEDRIVTR